MSNYEHPEHLSPQRVVCAACRCPETGAVVLGARHWDSVMRDNADRMGLSRAVLFDQGFIDQFGRYLTREEAYVIAIREGQFHRGPHSDYELFSEDLY